MTDSFPLQAGTVFRDRYILQEILHSSYWSLTLRALHQSDRQMVTLKLPGPGNAASGVNIAFHAAWMQRVYHSLSPLHHPNRATVLDYFETHGFPVLVQQEILGTPLSQRLLQTPLTEAAAIALVRKIAIALSSVHGKGLIHRDVRPETIIEQTATHQPVLVDWGLQPSVFPANRASSYAAPEQFQTGGRFQPTIDVYGLAATLYALVTGQPPIHAALRQQASLVLPRQIRPQLSLALERAILQGMEPNPQDRPPSMGAWLALLPEVSAPVSVPAGVPPVPTSAPTVSVAPSLDVTAPPMSAVFSPPQMPVVDGGEAIAPAFALTLPPSQPMEPYLRDGSIDPQPTARLMSSPKILALISLTTALLGGSIGLILRVAPPASLAGISGLGRTQSFPSLTWPGGGLAGDMPLDVPAPESQSAQEASGLSGATRQSLRDMPINTRPLREVLPPDSAEEAPVFEPIPEPAGGSAEPSEANFQDSGEVPAPNASSWNQPPLDSLPEQPLGSGPEARPEPRPSQGEPPAAPATGNSNEPAPLEGLEPEPADVTAPAEPVSPAEPNVDWSEPAAPLSQDAGDPAPPPESPSNEPVF
ncbi:MAG: protein kinase [Synechococcales cyanobacterium CRU_2_2]|nr:protein kinase [Synechococcales cyanobacterium CRU_2_2]